MKRRIFVAINFPEDIKEKLSNYQNNWPDLPARWVKKDNLHITLVFLGYLLDEELIEVFKAAKEAAQKNKSFFINLKKICYGPPKKTLPRSPRPSAGDRAPRMVWAEGEKSQELADLKESLEVSLLERVRPSPLEKGRGRPFSPHITLARIRKWEFRQMELEERPQIDEYISLDFEVNSIEIMESNLKKGGAEYTILESIPLSRE